MPDDRTSIYDLFEEACELPANERAPFLARTTNSEAQREEVTALLEAADDPLIAERLVRAFNAALEPELPPTRVRDYLIQEVIGEGSFGEVYLATHEDPTKPHRVAVKFLTALADDPAARSRFNREIGTLAALQHENVARLLWVPSQDEPLYLPMEHVDGKHFDAFLDGRSLPLERRLRLFLQVCDGINYIHSRTVLHLDLKPSNILVTEDPSVKVVDFGLAKLGADDEPGHRILASGGTPEFMSPEQLHGEPLAASADVYSLGVILYQVLSGQLPRRPEPSLDHSHLHAADGDWALSPSRAVTAWGTISDAKARGCSSPRGLARQLAGDLDAIVLCAIRDNPAKRYQTVHALAQDLRGYLEHRPVTAVPSTPMYLTQKFLRANRAIVIPVCTLLILAVGFGIVKSRDERRVSAERDSAEAVSDYLTALFQAVDPSVAQGSTTTARDLLDMGVARLPELDRKPILKARMESTLGAVHMELGLYDRAESLLLDAMTLEETQRLSPRQRLSTQLSLAILRDRQRKSPEAEKLLLRILPEVEKLGDPTTLGRCRRALATTLYHEGHPNEAEAMLRKALDVLPSDSARDRAATLNQLALVYEELDRFKDSEEKYLAAISLQKDALGTHHPDLAATVNNLGALYLKTSRLAEADERFREAERIWTLTIGENHPYFAELLTNRGLAARAKKDPKTAEQLFSRALAITQGRLGDRHPSTAKCLHNLGTALLEEGRFDDADKVLDHALSVYEAALGPTHPDLANTIVVMGASRLMRDQYEPAQRYYLRALAVLEGAHGPDHTSLLSILTSLANIDENLGDITGAEVSLKRALKISESSLGPRNLRTADIAERLGLLYGGHGRVREAADQFSRALSVRESVEPKGDELASDLLRLSAADEALGDLTQANALRARAMEAMQQLAMTETDIKNSLAERDQLAATFAKARQGNKGQGASPVR